MSFQQREGSRNQRFTDNQIYRKPVSMGRCKCLASPSHSFDMHLSCGPVFVSSLSSLRSHPWEWLLSQMTMTSFVLSTNYSPDNSKMLPLKRKGENIKIKVIKVKREVHATMHTIFFFFFFAISWATPKAYGGSQVRGLTGAVATGLHHSHSNVGSKLQLRLQPTPQLTATLDP